MVEKSVIDAFLADIAPSTEQHARSGSPDGNVGFKVGTTVRDRYDKIQSQTSKDFGRKLKALNIMLINSAWEKLNPPGGKAS